VTWNPYPRVPFEAVRDLLGITRALYRITRIDDPRDAERLRALEDVGRTLREVLAAATTHPGTIAHQNAWTSAERATKALGELVASTPLAPLVAATGLRIARPRRTMG
jgi:hypothetical protein